MNITGPQANAPLVSVVMPTYNRASYVAQSIKSVLQQSYTQIELIVVDDGSVDETEREVRAINDSRVTYIKNEENLGIQKTLNRGILAASGVYVARIDDQDEWIDTEKLAMQVAFLLAHPGHVLVGTGVEVVNEQGEKLMSYCLPETDEKIRKVILSKNIFIHPSVLFHKSAVEQVGLYSEESYMRHVEDGDLWLRLGMVGKLHNLQRISVRYVVDAGSISAQNRIEQMRKNITLITTYRHKYPGYVRARIRHAVRMLVYGYLRLSFISRLTSKL